MKVFFKYMLQAYRGKCDGLVYYYIPRLNRMIARPLGNRRETEQIRQFAAISDNTKLIQPSDGFRRDLAAYCDSFNRGPKHYSRHLNNWYNAFKNDVEPSKNLKLGRPHESGIRHPHRLEKPQPRPDRKQQPPCRSVTRAVEAGLQEAIPGYELLDKLI